MVEGKKLVQETDNALTRTERVVEDTIQIGQQVGPAAVRAAAQQLRCLPASSRAHLLVACRWGGLHVVCTPWGQPAAVSQRSRCPACCAWPAQTAATLHDQTQQLNKIVDDLNEIEFTMKKASKVIKDIGKGIMTDRWGPLAGAAEDLAGRCTLGGQPGTKQAHCPRHCRCISALLFLVVAGVIALVIVKVINPNKKAISATVTAITPNVTVNASGIINSAVNTVRPRPRPSFHGTTSAGLGAASCMHSCLTLAGTQPWGTSRHPAMGAPAGTQRSGRMGGMACAAHSQKEPITHVLRRFLCR
jgi:hypothetical protein